MTTEALENRSPTKRVKTRHTSQKVVSEVLVVEEPERYSSPLTELSSTSSIPPLAGILPPLQRLETPPPDRRNSPAPPLHTPDVPRVSVRQKANGSAPIPTPAPVRVPEPASTTPLVASGSRTEEAKAPVNTDKKPKLKSKGKKKGGLDSQFNMDDIRRDKRLSAVGPDFEVDNDRITHHQVGPNSRATMSHIFGGNPQRMISYPSPEKRRAHGFTSALLFPSRRFNPLLPTKIGERGLLFRLDQKLDQWVDNEGGAGPYHLMMHHTPDDYCYFGIYEFVRVDPVTKDEWLAQIPQVCHRVLNHVPIIILKPFRG